MPFNDTTNRLEAIFNFVDEFQSGDPANRSTFDQVVLDLIAGVNALATHFEELLVVGDLFDNRYLGRVDVEPTTRANGSPLQVGDFYNNFSNSRPNLFYIWDGTAFALSSDFAAISDFFKTLAVAADPATLRGLLGLGTAATQNSTAFAAAADVGGLATTLQLAADGLAKSLTDWDAAQTTGPGCGFFKGSAAALNAPAALNTVGVYLAYDANSGVVIASTPSNKLTYLRWRSAGVWDASWTTLASAAFPTGVPFSGIAPAAITDSSETITTNDDDTHLPTNAAVIDHVAAAVAAALAASGATLLGTITTTSGSSQTLSGLTLTGYKFLRLVWVGVSATSAGAFLVASQQCTANLSNALFAMRGVVEIDLTDGTFWANIAEVGVSASTTSAPYAGDVSTTTASTSISVGTTLGNFDAGTIRVYGIK